ncbi:MAG: hypothetical protein QOJ51_880 [Acidobacteriaceae bacterium]|nr:hypothetical protein [Acidobacteriaceae bacterium]
MQGSGDRGTDVLPLSGSAKESLAAILAHAKFVQTIPMTGMADDIVPMEAPVHSALRFVRIADNSTIEAFAELNCVSHGVPIETSLSLVNEHTLWHEHAYGFVTYGGDKPVATATAIINEGCLFLFLVATMPDGSTTKFLLDPKHQHFSCSPRSMGRSPPGPERRNYKWSCGSFHPRSNRSQNERWVELYGLHGRIYQRQSLPLCGNFTEARVDVYDSAFHRVNLQGTDSEANDDHLGDGDDDSRYSSEN